jgi:hypothetical protein
MNTSFAAASIFAAIAGMSLATATPSHAAPTCAEQMTEVKKDRDTPPVTGDTGLVDMHLRAAEKAMQAGDEATCLQETNMAWMSTLPDDHHPHNTGRAAPVAPPPA